MPQSKPCPPLLFSRHERGLHVLRNLLVRCSLEPHASLQDWRTPCLAPINSTVTKTSPFYVPHKILPKPRRLPANEQRCGSRERALLGPKYSFSSRKWSGSCHSASKKLHLWGLHPLVSLEARKASPKDTGHSTSQKGFSRSIYFTADAGAAGGSCSPSCPVLQNHHPLNHNNPQMGGV